MYLQDILGVCLQGLNSRFPGHVIDINVEILNIPEVEAEGWNSLQLIELFEKIAPDILKKMAQMNIDSNETDIYIPELSLEKPVFTIHCQGKLPSLHAARGVGHKKRKLSFWH
ncbi:hypothetical protein KDA_56510 [Dictyobacter alpinus]|uniref:Uncharacterized protein n=1 Tax=Dictyobacter alpinus TaxID=2014873 RepID=A0A402BFY0_9CHLR|nr:hypothetical protein [Dictyobacter alpinus]GCE30167.1 hypothetical protein KDA_56510 [Dictyobacter alpinus]